MYNTLQKATCCTLTHINPLQTVPQTPQSHLLHPQSPKSTPNCPTHTLQKPTCCTLTTLNQLKTVPHTPESHLVNTHSTKPTPNCTTQSTMPPAAPSLPQTNSKLYHRPHKDTCCNLTPLNQLKTVPHTPQKHLLHPHTPKPTQNCTTHSTKTPAANSHP